MFFQLKNRLPEAEAEATAGSSGLGMDFEVSNREESRWEWTDLRIIVFIPQHVISGRCEPSLFVPTITKAFENDINMMTSKHEKGKIETDVLVGLLGEKESTGKYVAKIKVMVRFSVGYTCVYPNCVQFKIGTI
ncbi:hypothetical protein U1Q18_028213 [Sarracenia purpurea var. burkii]